MTSLSVAAQPGRTMPRVPLGLMALTIAVAVGVGAIVGASVVTRTTTPAPAVASSGHTAGASAARHTTVAATSAVALVNYTGLVSNLAAAESQHDFAAKYRFERQLRATLTPSTIGAVYQEHSRLLKSMAEAKSTGNGYGIWLIGNELDALCGPAAVKDQLTFCN